MNDEESKLMDSLYNMCQKLNAEAPQTVVVFLDSTSSIVKALSDDTKDECIKVGCLK